MKPLRVIVLLTLLAGLALSLTADACPPVVVRQRVVHHQAVVVAPYVPTVAVVTPVLVPLYTAGYAGSDSSAALLAEIKALRAAVQAMKAVPSEQPVPQRQQFQQPQPPAMPQATFDGSPLIASCARCHSDGTAKGKVKLFEGGKRLPLPPESLGDAIEAVVKGTMPKGAKLSADAKVAVLAELIR